MNLILWAITLLLHLLYRASLCWRVSLKLFTVPIHGLKISLLVCDGGSSNIATIKATHSHHGAYSVSDLTDDKYEVKP